MGLIPDGAAVTQALRTQASSIYAVDATARHALVTSAVAPPASRKFLSHQFLLEACAEIRTVSLRGLLAFSQVRVRQQAHHTSPVLARLASAGCRCDGRVLPLTMSRMACSNSALVHAYIPPRGPS